MKVLEAEIPSKSQPMEAQILSFCMTGFQDANKGLLQHRAIQNPKEPSNKPVDEYSMSEKYVPNVDEKSRIQKAPPPLPTCKFMLIKSDTLQNETGERTLILQDYGNETDSKSSVFHGKLQQRETRKSEGSKRNKRKSTGNHHITSNKGHTCVICSKRFQRNLNLLEHIKTHTGERYYECPKCSKDFLRERDRQRHVDQSQVCGASRTHHECRSCSKVFRRSGDLERHVRHATCKKSLECPTCSKKFSRSSTLNQHVRDGTCKKTSLECPTCSKKFSRSSILERHVRNDVCKKALECPLCSKEFARHENLLDHIMRHTEEKAYACPKCSKECLKRSDLKRHLRRHIPGPIK